MPYRVKTEPILHNAIQVTQDNHEAVFEFSREPRSQVQEDGSKVIVGPYRASHRKELLFIATDSGWEYAPDGTWVIATRSGRLKLMGPDEFKAAYDEVIM